MSSTTLRVPKKRGPPFASTNRKSTSQPQSSSPLASSSPARPTDQWRLRQIRYLSYTSTIEIYHYAPSACDLPFLRSLLSKEPQKSNMGFVSCLVSEDLLRNITKPEGDEVPDGYVEVACLPQIFQRKGSALGFRLPDEGRIQWFCFRKPVGGFLGSFRSRASEGVEGTKLFDKVALLEKGGTGQKGSVKGHAEHKRWYEALQEAKHPAVKLKLMWKRQRKELAEYLREEQERKWREEDGDVVVVDMGESGAESDGVRDNDGEESEEGDDSVQTILSTSPTSRKVSQDIPLRQSGPRVP